MSNKPNINEVLELTTEIVSAHVCNNVVAVSELPNLIQEVYKALSSIGNGQSTEAKLRPAVGVKKSIFPDYIVCLEDGKKLKMLKRHLKTSYDMSPEEYRKRWNLGVNYPMVAPNYAKQRSVLAKRIGLGKKARNSSDK